MSRFADQGVSRPGSRSWCRRSTGAARTIRGVHGIRGVPGIRSIRALLAIASVAIAGTWSTAASADPPSFTEDALVTTALAQNPDLRAERVERDVAKAGETSAAAFENPTVRLEWLHAQNGLPTDSGWGVGLSWTPPQPTRLSARKEQARAHTVEVEQELRERAADLEAAVRVGFATADALYDELTVATRAVTTREALVRAIEERVKFGASTRIELSAARLAVVRAEQERDRLAIEHVTTVRKLAAFAGLTPGTTITLVPRDDDDDVVPSAQALEAQALNGRPLLRADDARAAQAAQAVRGEKARRWPWISFSSLPRYRVNDQSSYPHDLSFGIDVTVPIFDTNRGPIAAAEADAAHQAQLRAAHVATIANEIASAHEETRRRKEVVDRFRKTVETALEDHGALLREALQGRQVDVLALLAADDLVFQTQRQYAEARLSYRRARIALRRASGALGPRS